MQSAGEPPALRYPHIESRALFNNRLAAIVGLYHPLTRQPSVSLDELQRFDLALPSRGLQARWRLRQVAGRGAGLPFQREG